MSSIELAKVFHRSEGGMELERDIFEAVQSGSGAYFVPSTIHTKLDHEGKTRSSECVMLVDNDAMRHFYNWGCRVKILKPFYPKADMNPHVFYLPMNNLRDQNPNLTELEVADDLLRILEVLVKARVLKPDDFRLTVHFKQHAWFAFINFNQELTIDQLAFAHTWLRENVWTLHGIDQNVYVRYGRLTRTDETNK